MATGYSDPDGDITTQWNRTGGGAHYLAINDGVRQPTVPSTGSGQTIDALDGDESDIDEFTMDNSITDVAVVTQIVIWTYGFNTPANMDGKIRIYIGGWQTEYTLNFSSSWGWVSVTWNGSWSQAQLNGLQLRYTANSLIGKFDAHIIAAAYAQVTYTVPVVEYGHDFLGVPAANIGSVSGVPTANIDKIKGV